MADDDETLREIANQLRLIAQALDRQNGLLNFWGQKLTGTVLLPGHPNLDEEEKGKT